MTKFVGRRGTLGLAIEATRGTAVAPTFWVPYSTMNFGERVEEAREDQGLGVIEDSDSKFVTMQYGEGEVENQLYDKALGVILTGLFGASPSTSGSNPYTHTFTLTETNQHKSLSLYWTDPDRSLMFPLAMIDTFSLVVEPNGLVQYTVGFKSKVGKDWASQTADFTSLGNKFLHQHLQVKLAANIAGLGAATALSLKRFELNITKNSMHDFVMGTVEPEDVLNGAFAVEGSLELNLEDDTYKDYMRDGTYRSMEVKLNRSSSSSLTLQLPRLDFSAWEPDYTLNQIASQTINFKANRDAANALASVSTVTLVNAQASY